MVTHAGVSECGGSVGLGAVDLEWLLDNSEFGKPSVVVWSDLTSGFTWTAIGWASESLLREVGATGALAGSELVFSTLDLTWLVSYLLSLDSAHVSW